VVGEGMNLFHPFVLLSGKAFKDKEWMLKFTGSTVICIRKKKENEK